MDKNTRFFTAFRMTMEQVFARTGTVIARRLVGEAIQTIKLFFLDCFVASLLAMTIGLSPRGRMTIW